MLGCFWNWHKVRLSVNVIRLWESLQMGWAYEHYTDKRKKNSSWLWPRLTFWMVWIYVFSPSFFTSPYLGIAQMVKSLPVKWEAWVRSLGLEDPLEKEMAAHSSILAWKIPRAEEPGRLQSMGSHKVGYDWVTNTFTFPTLQHLRLMMWGGTVIIIIIMS